MIRILIVDDEQFSTNLLKLFIEKYVVTDLEVMVSNNPLEAIKILSEFKPTLLLLDVEMPLINGFDLLNLTEYRDFDIIFTTAYDKYAIKAIRFSALDYLLKPIDFIELQNAINRHIVKHDFNIKNFENTLIDNLLDNVKKNDTQTFKLALSTSDGIYFFNPKDIIRLEGDGNYTRFFFSGFKNIIISKTLKEYEELLSDYGFIRVHKSNIVNKLFVEKLDSEGMLWLKDGSKLIISRRRKRRSIKKTFKLNLYLIIFLVS